MKIISLILLALYASYSSLEACQLCVNDLMTQACIVRDDREDDDNMLWFVYKLGVTDGLVEAASICQLRHAGDYSEDGIDLLRAIDQAQDSLGKE